MAGRRADVTRRHNRGDMDLRVTARGHRESALNEARNRVGPLLFRHFGADVERCVVVHPLHSARVMNTAARRILAAHAVVTLARAQARGRAMNLATLAQSLGVSREATRALVTSLHAEGHVDALRMRVTMSGLVIAASLRDCRLRPIERRSAARVANVA